MDVERKKLLLNKYPEMEMTNWRKSLSFTHRNTKGHHEKVFKGDVLYCWPYIWMSNVKDLEPLVLSLSDAVFKRFHRRDPNLEVTKRGHIQDSIIFPIFCSPAAWREEALADATCVSHLKLELWATMMIAGYFIDDFSEDRRLVKDHAQLTGALARLLHDLFMLEFPTVEEFEQSLNYQYVVASIESIEMHLLIYFDMVEDFKSLLEETPLLLYPSRTVIQRLEDPFTEEEIEEVKNCRKETLLHLARSIRYWYELQTSLDDDGSSHFLSTDLHNELRGYTVASVFCFNFLILLDGIVVPEKVRANFYWDRCCRLYQKLSFLSNDIFSLQKEFDEARESEERIDNTILILMEVENLSLEEATNKCVEEHNEVIRDFRRGSKFALGNDRIKFDLSEDEKIIFDISLKAIGLTYSGLIHSQTMMPRYRNDNLQFTFTDLPPVED